MDYKDILEEVYVGLTANKVRTSLTVLGIIIGIASVIIMLSIGNGSKASIEESINSLGSNLLTISPGSGGNRPGQASTGVTANNLTLDDYEEVIKLRLVNNSAPQVNTKAQVVYSSENRNSSIIGTTESYKKIKDMDIEIGTFILDSHNRNFSKVAVLGPTTRDKLFGVRANPIGKKIKIKSNTYTVIGVVKAKTASSFGGSDDEIVYIPINTALQYLSGGQALSSINVTTLDVNNLDTLSKEIKNVLLDRHNIDDPELADFNIFNQASISDTLGTITSVFTILLGSVAGISLVVGGIGIMNMMLTTVRERTREIGLRKAIGARRGDISKQFLIESILITCFGGVIGILFGAGVSYLIDLTGITMTIVTSNSIILSFGVSALIGIVFGYYPAKKASKLNPIEALRFE